MAYGAAGRGRGIHDIYTFSNLKYFHGNRIAVSKSRIFLLASRAVCPCSSFVPASPRSVLPCRWSEKDCVHDRATDCAHDHAFDRLAPSVPSPVPRLSPSPRPVISSAHLSRRVRPSHPMSSISLFACPRRLLSSRPAPSHPTSRAGRGVSSRVAVLPPHVRHFIL